MGRKQQKPKVQHGSSSGGRFPILSPAEAERLGIDTSPVLVISPVPITDSEDVPPNFSDYGPDDPFYKQGPQAYSPHWARTFLKPKPK